MASPPASPSKDSLPTPNRKSAALDRISTQISAIYDSFVLGSCFDENKTPIIFVNKGFVDMTGYCEDELVAKEASCEFLFGQDTHPSHAHRVSAAVKHRTKSKLSMILNKKSGTSYLATVETQPIKDEMGQVVLIAISISITSDLRNPSSQFLVPHSRGLMNRKIRTKLGDRNKSPNSHNMTDPEHGRHHLQMNQNSGICGGWLIDCNSTFKTVWDWLIILATIYAGVTAPYNAVFYYQRAEFESVLGDIIVGILFVIDIVLNFRTTYYDNFGQPVRDRRRIAKRYLMGWFWIDLIAAFPFDLLTLLGAKLVSANSVVLLKCVRLLRLTKIWVALELYSEYSSVILAFNMVLYVLLAHWFACIWYYIGRYEWYYEEKNWNVGWMYKLYRQLTHSDHNKPPNVTLNPHDMQLYWTAMYFSLTALTTVGFGNEAPNAVDEKIAMCIALPCFALMHAVVFGQVTAIIQRMYARRFAYDIQQKELRDFYRIYSVPKPLKRKMQEFFETQWTVHRGIRHEKIIGDFPEDLKADVLEHMYGDFLGLPIFNAAPRDCLKMLALHIKHTFINPGEFLIRAGDVARSYYFVCSGSIEVAHADGEVTALVGKEELLGGDLTEFNGKSGVDVKAVTYCDLHTLKVDKLVGCLSMYPKFAVTFAERLDRALAVNLTTKVSVKFSSEQTVEEKVSWQNRISLNNESENYSRETFEFYPYFRKVSPPNGRNYDSTTSSDVLEQILSEMQQSIDKMADELKQFRNDMIRNL